MMFSYPEAMRDWRLTFEFSGARQRVRCDEELGVGSLNFTVFIDCLSRSSTLGHSDTVDTALIPSTSPRWAVKYILLRTSLSTAWAVRSKNTHRLPFKETMLRSFQRRPGKTRGNSCSKAAFNSGSFSSLSGCCCLDKVNAIVAFRRASLKAANGGRLFRGNLDVISSWVKRVKPLGIESRMVPSRSTTSSARSEVAHVSSRMAVISFRKMSS